MHKFCYKGEKRVMKQRGPGNKAKPIRLWDRKREKEKSQWVAKTVNFNINSSHRWSFIQKLPEMFPLLFGKCLNVFIKELLFLLPLKQGPRLPAVIFAQSPPGVRPGHIWRTHLSQRWFVFKPVFLQFTVEINILSLIISTCLFFYLVWS